MRRAIEFGWKIIVVWKNRYAVTLLKPRETIAFCPNEFRVFLNEMAVSVPSFQVGTKYYVHINVISENISYFLSMKILLNKLKYLYIKNLKML